MQFDSAAAVLFYPKSNRIWDADKTLETRSKPSTASNSATNQPLMTMNQISIQNWGYTPEGQIIYNPLTGNMDLWPYSQLSVPSLQVRDSENRLMAPSAEDYAEHLSKILHRLKYDRVNELALWASFDVHVEDYKKLNQ